jgi:hypothetical protein
VHLSSVEATQGFADHYLADRRGERLRVLDVASVKVNGTYRARPLGWS